jgi:hypothetical protein
MYDALNYSMYDCLQVGTTYGEYGHRCSNVLRSFFWTRKNDRGLTCIPQGDLERAVNTTRSKSFTTCLSQSPQGVYSITRRPWDYSTNRLAPLSTCNTLSHLALPTSTTMFSKLSHVDFFTEKERINALIVGTILLSWHFICFTSGHVVGRRRDCLYSHTSRKCSLPDKRNRHELRSQLTALIMHVIEIYYR